MVREGKSLWLQMGYQTFSKEGLAGLRVERLSKELGISKSSFYHLFVDFENYQSQLYDLHEERILLLLEKEKLCQNIFPDFISLCLEAKEDIFFHQKLRLLRSEESIRALLDRLDLVVMDVFISIWAKEIQKKWDENQFKALFPLAAEYFFSKVEFERYTEDVLNQIFQDLISLSHKFQ